MLKKYVQNVFNIRKITNLVDAAGEVFGLTEDPLGTIIGMRIDTQMYRFCIIIVP